MDPAAGDSSVEGLFEGNAPPSPSPAPRQSYPTSPKDIHMSSSLAFRPPPRPGSSLRKGRKSDFNTPAPPPLPTSLSTEYRALLDSTNLEKPPRNSEGAASPTRPASSTSIQQDLSDQGKAVDMTRLAKERLRVLREENESQVNSAGLLGQGLLELRAKIESLMDELAEELSAAEDQSESSHDSKGPTARIRILGERIEAEIEELERQKRKLFSEITVHNVDITNGDVEEVSMLSLAETPSKATRVANAIRNLTATPGKSPTAHIPSTPRQGDRRSRNAAARQAKADTDLINEIQAGLVQEVRRLQGLLKERDDQRMALERSHTELEKQLDQYKPRVIQMTEAEDALKQENWDLSVAKQNLEEQLGEMNIAFKKAELETLRLTKDVAKARETVDSQRLQIDGHVAEIERLNKTRETEIALARRERAGMQRDVSDLQSELQKFKTQQLNDRGGVSRSVSHSFMSDATQEEAGEDAEALANRLRASVGDSPRSPGDSIYSADNAALSPLGNRLGRDKEAQDLRAKLAMAQRKAGKDAAEKRRVREKNVELKKLLVQAGVKIPQGLDDDAETSEDEELHWIDEANANSPSAKRLSQMRASRPNSIRPRLGRKMGMVSSNSTDSIIEYGEYEDVPAGHQADESPSRASLEGMDPAFADMLRSEAANTSTGSTASGPTARGHRSRLSIGSSPLARNAVLHEESEEDSPMAERALPRGGRRSGATVRASSGAFEPSALGNELGGLAAELEQAAPPVEMEEAEMQTDDMPDMVAPALAERDAQHAEAVKVIQAEHAAKLAELAGMHDQAINTLEQTHQEELDGLKQEHSRALTEKDQAHAAQLASTLADRTKIHEAALAEARSRHSRALAEQVAASSAALAEVVAQHKTSSEDLERKHKEERERKESSHQFALSQKDREHQEALQSMEGSHALDLNRLRTEHAQILALREKALEEADAQLEQHQNAYKELETSHASTLASLKAEHQQILDARHRELAARERELEEAKAEIQKLQGSIKNLRDELQRMKEQATQLEQTHASTQRELEETKSDLGSLNEKVRRQEEAAAELARQKEAEAAAAAAAVAARSEALTANEAAKEQLEASHALIVAQKDRQHQEAVKALEDSHANAISQMRDEHKQASAAREQTIQEHRDELNKLQSTIDEHKQEADKLQTTVRSLEAQLVQLRQDSSSVQQSREATEKLLKEARSAHEGLQRQHDEAKSTIASLQSKVRYLESAISAEKSSTEQNRLASDKELQTIQSALNTANKKAREQEAAIAKAEAAAAAATAAAAAAQAQLLAKNEAVTDTENEAESFEDAVEVVATPRGHKSNQSVDQQGIRQVVLADLKETSCQTDDAAWTQFQEQLMMQHQQHQRSLTPTTTRPGSTLSSAPGSPFQHNENLVGQGGIVILGGLKSNNRPRDSVSTFGGVRDGGFRTESPAPTMYSADAFTSGRGQQARRPSVDSNWSRHTDKTNNEVIPPVPALPDKTKPPMMSMPPPPSIPPPHSVTMKPRSSLGTMGAPPRPTSPPPADLLTRAQQHHLQLPVAGEQSRSVSRTSTRSGAPPSSYPSSIRARQQSAGAASVRTRTHSGETNASAQQQPLDAGIYSSVMGSARKSNSPRKSASGNAKRPATGPRRTSAASFVSDVTSELSRRLSMMSSQASEADAGDETFVVRRAGAGNGPKTTGSVRGLSEFGADSTDPAIIHAITQTMIGEYMFKYTRKSMGRGGHSDKRHKRYFWLHPYTKMLYWTLCDPGGARVSEGTSKSASIESVRVVEDSNPSPPGLHHESLIVTTASREVKLTAPSRERHEAWLAALEYLVHRPTIQDATVIAGNAAPDLMSDVENENDPSLLTRSLGRRARSRTSGASSTGPSRLLAPQRSFMSRKSSEHGLRKESTPRKRNGSVGGQSVLYPSVGKRRDTAAREWLQQYEHDREASVTMSPSSSLRRGVYSASVRSGDAADDSYDMLDLTATQSPLRRGLAEDDARLKTAEQMLEEDEPEDWDGLTNVRACCDGKHDVGTLAHDHPHNHHHHRREGTSGGSSDKGSRKSSRLHRRQSSGGTRFASLGLKSKLDAAVRASEQREQQAAAAPRLSSSMLPNSSGLVASIGGETGKMSERESMDSNASMTRDVANKPRISDSSFANIFAPLSPSDKGNSQINGASSGSKVGGSVGPSYGERIQKIRQARQSTGSDLK